jgi:hypothetical protein
MHGFRISDSNHSFLSFVNIMAVTIFFKNIVHKPQDVVSLASIPFFLYVGYLTGKCGGARVWLGTMLFITLAMAVLYAFF